MLRNRLLIFVLWLLATSAHADIYKYVDENGVMHFTNTPTSNRFSFYRHDRSAPGRGMRSSVASVSALVRQYSCEYNIEEGLVHAVIKAESNYNPAAVSRKGAQGLMQLMPETARLLKVSDPFDVEENIRGGSCYLRQMLDAFDGNVDLAIAAYNAGPNAVRRHGGIPPINETQIYVDRVKKYLRSYRQGGAAWL